MSAAKLDSTKDLSITIVSKANEKISFVFFCVPQLAADLMGEIRIEWSDGRVNSIDCAISDGALTEMVNNPQQTAVTTIEHSYPADGKRTVRISSPSGFLPLKELPLQTVSIDSALPVLTRGETDEKGSLLASDTLPRLVGDDPNTGQCALGFVCPELLSNNPQLAFFDESFRHAGFAALPARFFSHCTKIKSLVRTFAESAIENVPARFLGQASYDTLCEETFAHCSKLEQIENPFKKNVLPCCLEGFLEGAPSRFFSWCDPYRREELGWIRPPAQATDPSFDFEWTPSIAEASEQLVIFYPIDLELKGDLLVEWGDGTVERIDWNQVDALEHAYSTIKPYCVRIHSTAGEPVRPFQLGRHVRKIFTPLPAFHPRTAEARGDFCGWAANRRELTELPAAFFANNPAISNLEQAFAGCVKLEVVPDDILSGLKTVNADGMFAFCKNLPGLPASFRALARDKTLDYFSHA